MTDDELLVADLLLARFTPNESLSIPVVFDNLLNYNIQRLNSDEQNRIYNEVISKGYRPIRNFLLEQDYITCVDSAFPKDQLTDKGKTAKRMGGHYKYLEFEKKEVKIEKITKKKKAITERVWLFIIALLGSLIAAIVFDKIKYPNEENSKKKILQSAKEEDTIPNKYPSQKHQTHPLK